MSNEDFLTEEEDYKGYNIKIYFDEDAESPREWDNICVIHTAHKNYSIGDEDHSTRESIEEARRKTKTGGVVKTWITNPEFKDEREQQVQSMKFSQLYALFVRSDDVREVKKIPSQSSLYGNYKQ